MNINRIFEYLNDCPDAAFLKFSEEKLLFCDESSSLGQEEEVKSLFGKWILFQALSDEEKEALFSEQFALTAGKVRDLYRRVVVQNLQRRDLQSQLLALASSEKNQLTDRIALVEEKGACEVKVQNIWFESLWENREQTAKTMDLYLKELNKSWGETRVRRALDRSGINFSKKRENWERFTLKEAQFIQLSLFEVTREDVSDFHQKILSFNRGEASLEVFSEVERAGLARCFGEELDEVLLELFSREGSFDELESSLAGRLIEALRPEDGLEDLAFGGSRIEGVISGHQENNAYRVTYLPEREAQERLQMVQKMRSLTAEVSGKHLDHAYDELLALAAVKKSLFEGMLLPAPGNEWYVVQKRIYGKSGKLAYYLKPFPEKGSSLPERLVYRSTASDPYHFDSLGTVLSDLSPYEPPGYFGGTGALNSELKLLLKEGRDLRIIGHSLGGSYAQLAMIHLVEELNRRGDNPPDKRIQLVCLGAPAIKASDCKVFAEWFEKLPLKSQKALSIEYHFSKPDFVPGAGERHLGYGCQGLDLSFHLLDAKDETLPELRLHPHGRFYYMTRLGTDFSDEPGGIGSLEAFDEEPWRQRIESLRYRVGLGAYPLLLAARGFKRWLFSDNRENPQPKLIKWLNGTPSVIEPLETYLIEPLHC